MGKVILVLAILFGGWYWLAHNNAVTAQADTNRFHSIAAVSLAAGTFDGGNTPAPVTPDHLYPRKDCPFCHGTGYIVNGDGNRSECSHCEPDKSPFDKAKPGCGPLCTCGDKCECTHEECLTRKANKPCGDSCTCGVSCKCTDAKECLHPCGPGCKCDPCTCTDKKECLDTYRQEAQPAPFVDSSIKTADFLMRKCARAYLDSHWAESAKYLQDAKENLAVSVPGVERDALVRKAEKASKMLSDKGLADLNNTVVVRKDLQDKHRVECAAFVKSVESYKAAVEAERARKAVEVTLPPLTPMMDFGGGSCGGGGCGMGGFGGDMMMGGCGGGGCGGGCGGCR